MKNYFIKKGYKIIDDSLFKSLAHTFHIIAESEEENISKKKKSDENFNKEYNKPNKKRDIKMMTKEGSKEEKKETRVKAESLSTSMHHWKRKHMIPGFSIIKNKIITPLLIASEKVVEYIIPEKSRESENSAENKAENTAKPEEIETVTLEEKMSKLSLEEARKQRKRTLKYLRKSNQNANISKDLLKKASE